MTPSSLYERMVDRRVRKLAPLWESRIGETGLRLNAETWVRFKLGWLTAVLGCAVFAPVIWSGAAAEVTVPLVLAVLITSGALMCSALPVIKRHMKATMQHLGLPEKPAITAQALQSPEDFDIWLLETRQYHNLEE
ncbi:hypothetical protein [Arthrobacter sp. Y81]|uniref:hypothetical protein n=1 Tax=Arthrobacter sp. Y81 TaxID=2058897 RepID=UPI000CE4A5D0|nr:hypothetical protein [Arthrobacter sp. Y81]